MDFYIAMGSLIGALTFMTLLMLYNLKDLRDTKELRLDTRRAEKKIKNERLRKAFKLPDNRF